MTDKSGNTSISIRISTRELIDVIRKHNPKENGISPGMPEIMIDIVDFYVQGHPELKGEQS